MDESIKANVQEFKSYLEDKLGSEWKDIEYFRSGGQLHVFTCRRDETKFAAKVLPLASSSDAMRFQRQQILIGTEIPGFPMIVEIYNPDDPAHYFPFVVQKFIEGYTLAEIYGEDEKSPLRPPFSNQEVLDNTNFLLETFGWFHEKSLLLRDIEPRQVVIGNEDKKPYIVDSSAVLPAIDTNRITRSFTGKALHFAPEEVEEGKYTFGTDLYHLGLLVLSMYSFRNIEDIPKSENGGIAFDYKSSMFPEKRDERIETIIDRLLQRREERRYRDVQEVRNVIEVISNQRTRNALSVTTASLPESARDFIPPWIDMSFYVGEHEALPEKKSGIPRHYFFFYSREHNVLTEYLMEEDRLTIYNLKRGVSPNDFIETRKRYADITDKFENNDNYCTLIGGTFAFMTALFGSMISYSFESNPWIPIPIALAMFAGSLGGEITYRNINKDIRKLAETVENMRSKAEVLYRKNEKFMPDLGREILRLPDNNERDKYETYLEDYVRGGVPILLDKA